MSASFVQNLTEKAREIHQPLFSTIEITHQCNFKCHHCYNFDRLANKESPLKNILTDQEIISSIKQLAQAGALYLNITGGEPLRHPSLINFIQEAKRNSFFVRVKSNGSLLTRHMAQTLYDEGLDAIDISLYGMSEKSYQQFTSSSKLSAVLDGLKSAYEVGLDLHISLILHRYNIHELEEMISYCEKHNYSFQISDEITDRYDHSNARSQLSITKDQYDKLLKGPYSHIFQCDNSEKSLQCNCAQTVCAIAANGDVYPCIGAPLKSGNIREHSFDYIWNHSKELNHIRGLSSKDFKECQSCDFITTCSRSSGSALINTGKYTGCDPFALMRAKARQE